MTVPMIGYGFKTMPLQIIRCTILNQSEKHSIYHFTTNYAQIGLVIGLQLHLDATIYNCTTKHNLYGTGG